MLAACLVALGQGQARAQDTAEAAQRPPLIIPIFLSSRSDQCYDNGSIAAIRSLTVREQERINREGGVAGRFIRVRFLDDRRSQEASLANMRAALADPYAVAMVGVSNSNTAKVMFDRLGPEIGTSGIPFLSNISISSIFKPYANVFTTRASQDDERLPVMAQFIRSMNFGRVAFAGRKDSVFSNLLGDGLKTRLGAEKVIIDHRIGMAGDNLDPAQVSALVADVQRNNPDMIVLSIGTTRASDVMAAIKAAGVTPAVFLVGTIGRLNQAVVNGWPNAIYQLAWDHLPSAFNERLRRSIAEGEPSSWVFEGTKVSSAPGWAKGTCKERPVVEQPDPLEARNLQAISTGTQYADMVALIAAAGRKASPRAGIAELRRHIVRELSATYAADRGAFKGSFENWSFDPQTRAARRTPFVLILPQGLGRTQLAPLQFVRTKSGGLQAIDTLYVDIDLIRAHRIEDNEKTFFAEFYLSMHDDPGASIDRLEFANAYLDPRTNGRQITQQVVHGGGASAAFPDAMKIYRISGRFTFEPELSGYPFDTQRFAIEIQPKRGDATFIVQQPPLELRDRQVETDGWTPRTQYVGYDEDFVPVVDAYSLVPSIIPFYKASYVWMMQRETTDYFLRVAVPLAFILIVAYLSIFIPPTHFEAIVTIQVTALLSAVALYLALPKLDADTATLSDRIFLFDYMMVSLMIVISILRVNRYVAARSWIKGTLGFLHVVVIPLL
ncbi:MAG: ABC transporter substrate-binding protein, partial [Hyphomicrobiaceae bacterium]